MDIKLLISIINRPWFIEPGAAQHWAELADNILKKGSMPATDTRKFYGDQGKYGFGPVFRVGPTGAIDTAGSIQVFRMDAPIAKYDYCGSPGSQTWIQHLAAANADDGIKSILLWIDSPGGQVDGTEALANEVLKSKKPVVAFADSVMCSASYWIGSSASEVIVDGSNNGWNATIGSIGTMVMWEDDTEKRAKEGVKRMTVFADASSDKWGDYRALLQGDYTRLKQELNGINETFLEAVKSNRAGKLKLDKENVLSGKVYNADEAIKFGLADRKGTFLDAVKRATILSNKAEKTQQMNKTALAFGTVLVAAKASEFQVVDGGFLVTEDQLNNIEATLDQHQVIAIATASQLKTLQAQAESFKVAEKSAKDLLAAQDKITQLEVDLKAEQEKVAALGKQPGATFIEPGAAGDDANPGAQKQEQKKQYSFDKNAAEVLDL